MPYAAQTRVPISRTKTDIEELLVKHGATGFAYALSWQTSVQSLPSRVVPHRTESFLRLDASTSPSIE